MTNIATQTKFSNPLDQFGSAQVPQMMRLKDVIQITRLSRSTIYDIMDKKSKRYDPTFPKQIKLTERSVVWRADEITAWLESKFGNAS